MQIMTVPYRQMWYSFQVSQALWLRGGGVYINCTDPGSCVLHTHVYLSPGSEWDWV